MPSAKKIGKNPGKSAVAAKAKSAGKPKKSARVASAPPVQRTRETTKSGTGKNNYSKTELEYFKSVIMEKRKEILEELETLRDGLVDNQTGEYVSENSSYSTHMEQGTDAMEREKMFLFASREGKFLNHLDDALKRIVKGDYGHCTECGKLIEKERLEAVPHAQQCLQCKVRKGR
jgi:RNA polymerase-binding protein DksA